MGNKGEKMTVYIIVGDGYEGARPVSVHFIGYCNKDKAMSKVFEYARKFPNVDFRIEELEVVE